MNERAKDILKLINEDLEHGINIAKMPKQEYIDNYNKDNNVFPIDYKTVYASKFGVTSATLEIVKMRLEQLERVLNERGC